ncbi:unnamed protein product [Blepharisma stoltei]|uniref:NUC153 domain-containing protein n=1 Tax=Blepharisma stoltei TaxID=1481888 RepID=A0AAU9JFF4_9CILI|nr:unnamed protein product [Blepharisma stoltei]
MGKKDSHIKDSRFSKIHTDPRFRTQKPEDQKVKLDERFTSMFTKKDFQGPVPSKVDERGRKVKDVSNPLTEIYDTSGIECIDAQGKFKWDVESSSSSGEEDEINLGEDLYEQVENIPEGGETNRLAVTNCDFRIVKAVDLLALFSSFCPGDVAKVTIYPSQFGMERMKKETVAGPVGDFSGVDPEEDDTKLRKYELDQLKYYFAVVECNSIEAAIRLYEECDGLEIERTSNFIDLRFIPDDVQDFKYPAKEIANEVPKNHQLLHFYTKALQHSRVELTWDETPKERTQKLQSAFAVEDLDEVDLQNYIAPMSSSEEEEPDDYDMPQKRNHQGKISQFKAAQKDNMELEIKFNSVFDSIAQEATKEKKDETTWEKHLREKKEEKKNKKAERKAMRKQMMKDKMKERKDKKLTQSLELLVDSKGEEKEFKFNENDERFKKIYTDSKFGIDPTDTRFKRDLDGNKMMLSNQIKKRKIEENDE